MALSLRRHWLRWSIYPWHWFVKLANSLNLQVCIAYIIFNTPWYKRDENRGGRWFDPQRHVSGGGGRCTCHRKTLCTVLQLLEDSGISAENVSVTVVAEFPVHRDRELLPKQGFGRVNVQSLLVIGGAWGKTCERNLVNMTWDPI